MQKTQTDRLNVTGNGTSFPSMDFHTYGGHSIRKSLRTMLSLAEGVRLGSDVEAVHDMRVSSRRLRAAISVFEPAFKGKRYQRFRRHVKTLTDALSRARDLDVMIGAVSKLCKETPPPERIGLDEFRDHLAARRTVLQKPVLKSLKNLESAGLLEEFAGIAPAFADSEKPPSKLPESGDLEREFASSIRKRVVELRSWEPYIENPRQVVELHQMRIAAKRLRYTMELFVPYRGPLFSGAIDRVRQVQEQLGKIHDADVLAPALLAYLGKKLSAVDRQVSNGVYAADTPTLMGLLVGALKMRTERELVFERFQTTWKELEANGLLDHILSMADSEVNNQSEMKPKGRHRRK